MDWKLFATVFGVVFVAELGDKTQLAALALSGSHRRPFTVFLAAWLALGATTALAVAVGTVAGRFISERALGIAAGLCFLALGAWTLWSALRQAPAAG